MVLSCSSHKAIAKLLGHSLLMQNIPLPQGEFLRLGDLLLWSPTWGLKARFPLWSNCLHTELVWETWYGKSETRKYWGLGRKLVPEIGKRSQILLSVIRMGWKEKTQIISYSREVVRGNSKQWILQVGFLFWIKTSKPYNAISINIITIFVYLWAPWLIFWVILSISSAFWTHWYSQYVQTAIYLLTC